MKTVSLQFTKDELRVISFLVAHRNDPNSASLFQDFYETIGSSEVGVKVNQALANWGKDEEAENEM